MATEATLTKIDRLALEAWTKIDADEGREAAEELRGIANDLLAACEAARDALIRYQVGDDGAFDFTAIIGATNAAIAKARGTT